MADCECIPGCPFFNDKMADMPSMSEIYKMQYCKGDFDSCARHMIFKSLGKQAVPSDLYPNDKARATGILASGG